MYRGHGATAGEPAGGPEIPKIPTTPKGDSKIFVIQFRASGRRILLRTPLKHRKWSTLSCEFADSPAIFITFQAHRNTCTGCSESRPRPPECKTVQRCLQLPKARYPRLQGPIRPLIIHAQAAGNLTRQLSFMHPVHSVASTGHTGDPQDLTTRPLQEISRAAHISSDQLRSAHISTAQIT